MPEWQPPIGIVNLPRANPVKRHDYSVRALFDYPADIRKVIYTTNAIESLNSVIRKAVDNRKLFPCDASATKVVVLVI